MPSESSTPESSAADDGMLRQYSAAIVDILAMEKMVHIVWDQEIRQVLPDQESAEEAEPEGTFSFSIWPFTNSKRTFVQQLR